MRVSQAFSQAPYSYSSLGHKRSGSSTNPNDADSCLHNYKRPFGSLPCLFSTAQETQQSKEITTSATETDGDTETNGSSSLSKVLAEDSLFIKPKLDTRKYRCIKLKENDLQILLVSDPQTDVEAASVHIRAGHFNDPDHRPGLAHFHEHMLFLGTEKYSDLGENEFEEFLGKNGGSSNAYTDMEDTNYYFSVAPLDHDDGEEDDVDDTNDEEGGDNDGKVTAALSGAIDRFAQFFISPLFSTDAVERELRAIDSEYLNSITSDSWKGYQLLKNTASEGHPFRKFGCGNYKTLTDGGIMSANTDDEEKEGGVITDFGGGTSPRDDLVKFWESYYVADNMKVAVVGRASLDELQKVVEESFAGVRPTSTSSASKVLKKDDDDTKLFQTEHSKYNNNIPAFGPSQLSKIRELIPVVDMRTVKFFFATPPADDPILMKHRPDRVLSHIIGHEGPGSLHALLLEDGLINSLSSGSGVSASDFSLSAININLTPKGMKQRDRVVSLVWQWINLVRDTVETNDELMKQYHEELTQMSKMHFTYRENGDPTDFSSAAAEYMFDFPPEKILVGTSMPDDYNAGVTKAFLDRFTPENCIITPISHDLENETMETTKEDEVTVHARNGEWQLEKWYKAKYREVDMPEETKESWSKLQQDALDPRLKLPALNDFLPTDFNLRADDEKSLKEVDPSVDYSKTFPKLLLDKPGLQLWHKMDRTFKVPKTSLKLHLASPNTYRSPRTMTLNRLFAKVLEDDLNSYIYDALLAGCRARVACLPSGFSIGASGFSEKLPLLLDTVTSRMLSLIGEMKEGAEARPGLARTFEKAKDNLARQTKNFYLDSPYELGSYSSRMMLESNVWHLDSYIAELEGEYAERDPLTMEECAKVAEECLTKRLSAQFLCMGNIDEEGANEVVKLINDHFLRNARPLQYEEMPGLLSYRLPTKDEAVKIFGPSVENSSTSIVLQEVARTESEENCSVEYMLQTGSQYEMGYEGVALLELIGHMAYNSAFDQLRTKEQLGYIVSAFTKRTAGGGYGFAVVVQSSSAAPSVLEERIEMWLAKFREELEAMPAERLAMEAAAVVAILLERNMRFKDEVSYAWGEIMSASRLGSLYDKPDFVRAEKLAAILSVKGDEVETSDDDEKESNMNHLKQDSAEQLKEKVLKLWDTYFVLGSPERRALSTRVYNTKTKDEFEENVGKSGYLSSWDEIRQLKQFLSQLPTAPYWIERR